MTHTSRPVRIGLVGFGLFGQHHARTIAATAGAELAAIAVRSQASRLAATGAFPGVRTTTNYRELLVDESIDLIDVVVPNRLHFQLGEEVLRAGKHLFLEKPMALTRPQCDHLIALAAAVDRRIAINHELRLSRLWRGVKELIDQGVIGEPLFALIELSRFPYRPGSEGWRYDIEQVGNWILEEPIHFFDLARWYLSSRGEPYSIYARANSRWHNRPELQDNFSCIVNFPGGAYAVISQTLAAFEHHVTAKVAGTEGTIWAHWSAPDARSEHPTFGLRYGLADNIHEVSFDKPTGELLELADHLQALVDHLQQDTPLPCTALDGRWSSVLCLAAQESVDSGQVVRLQ